MLTMPDGTSVIAFEVVYAGDPAMGEKELEPLRRIGQPIDDGVKVQDYTVMQTAGGRLPSPTVSVPTSRTAWCRKSRRA